MPRKIPVEYPCLAGRGVVSPQRPREGKPGSSGARDGALQPARSPSPPLPLSVVVLVWMNEKPPLGVVPRHGNCRKVVMRLRHVPGRPHEEAAACDTQKDPALEEADLGEGDQVVFDVADKVLPVRHGQFPQPTFIQIASQSPRHRPPISLNTADPGTDLIPKRLVAPHQRPAVTSSVIHED